LRNCTNGLATLARGDGCWQELEAKGFVTSDELEADQLSLQRRQIEVKEAELADAESPYKAGAYAFEHHEEVSSYATLQADQAAYAQTEKVHMEQEPHEVEVEDFHDKFEVDRTHTEVAREEQPPAEEEPAKESDFDIDDIISELMTQSQKKKTQADEATPETTKDQEENTVVTPARVLMPKQPGTVVKRDETEDEN